MKSFLEMCNLLLLNKEIFPCLDRAELEQLETDTKLEKCLTTLQ